MKVIILPTTLPGSKSVLEASQRASASSAEASTSMLVLMSNSSSSSESLASASLHLSLFHFPMKVLLHTSKQRNIESFDEVACH